MKVPDKMINGPYSSNIYADFYKNQEEPVSDTFRSPQSDVEVPKARKRVTNDSAATLTLDPLAVTKENMSTANRRPTGKLIGIIK